jgi:drug/metabolite transporter (DMT)-like permease
MLWGTDPMWRTGLLQSMPAAMIVFWTHVVSVLATGWLLLRDRRSLRRLDRGDWVAVGVIGVGASALATVLFTQAFALASPTTVLLVQKTQPLISISVAALFLREPLPNRFWQLMPIALLGAYFIMVGDAGPLSLLSKVGGSPVGALMALGAAALWACGTVLGRRLLGKLEVGTLTAVRFAAALPALGVIALASGWGGVPTEGQLMPILASAVLGGMVAVSLYYRGLRETPVGVAALCELSFPVGAILVNWLWTGVPATPYQILGVTLLWGALALLGHRSAPARAALAPAAMPV